MAVPRRSPSSTGVCTRAERQPGDCPPCSALIAPPPAPTGSPR